ncbi:hypothetical protein BGZ95_005491 [Linnemannia exigua]|uniref:Uncharacterized protein n=1 Tax=Linnemannia exigua TaxID=604196 RepID=A0AAD4DH48_9FUNG|nr:hypothetical protein BGZ95_005491 [Linnemannia exigua]
MPSPSMVPQSILIKDESYFAPASSTTTNNSSSNTSGGLFARRGSESSVSSTGSGGSHDCFHCGLHTSDNDSSSEDGHHRHGTLSRSPSESSTGSTDSLTAGSTTGSSNGSRRLRVQWVDRI